MKIGLFDSGIGGLTVLAQIMKLMPEEEYIYYADSDNCPYGIKTKEEIYALSKKAVVFLKDKGCDIVCIACNTATSVAAARLREEYDFPIVGVEPAVKPAIDHMATDGGNGRILVIATPMTVNQKKLHDLIDRLDEEHLVDMKALGNLPGYAEKGDFGSPSLYKYFDRELGDEKYKKYTKVVLGCTHFIHYTEPLSKYFSDDVEFLDGAEGTARNIRNICSRAGLETAGHLSIEFYRSGHEASEENVSFYRMILDRLSKK